jgi:hypothetical protein
MIDFIGGRTRTRTWDPLIKSPPRPSDPAPLFFKPNHKAHVAQQRLAPGSQTGEHRPTRWRARAANKPSRAKGRPMKARHGPPRVGTRYWASRAALGARRFIDEMKNHIEQRHEQ